MSSLSSPRAGTTALITGASGGIGYELARVFARHGHAVILVARSIDKMNTLAGELQRQHGVTARVLARDLSAATAAQEIAAELAGTPIDILVNNAGIEVYGKFHETAWDAEMRLIQINLLSLTHLTKLLLPGMVQRGYGRVLNLGSTGSFVGAPFNAVYAATKAYVLNFSQAIAEELRGTGVTVTALCPGVTRTQLQARADMDHIRLMRFGAMEADRVAEAGYRALMAGRHILVPGLINKLQAASGRMLPSSWTMRLARFLMQG